MSRITNTRPYPGLRPFRKDESEIFFGREEYTRQLLEKLSDSRFISVIGTSGCGKSSLMQAGMIAALENECSANTDTDCHILLMRPGSSPMWGLAEALLSGFGLGPESPDSSGEPSQEKAKMLSWLLDAFYRSPSGLVECLRETAWLSKEADVLLIVDQFEELFRVNGKGRKDEAEAFVSLLLASVAQDEIPIRVVTTMRSEYIASCGIFRGLPEVVSNGQFLVPPMTCEQQEMAIVNPARVFGGTIAPDLVAHLLNEMENGYYHQLPVLQHCLMRMWPQNEDQKASEVLVTMKDYERVGGLKDALSLHADEAFDELNQQQQTLAERMFRCLSGYGSDGQYVRYPMQLKEIATISGVSEAEVKEVIEIFRHPDRCFLLPPVGADLEADTVIDINHESLIQSWKKLGAWVEEEAEAAAIYRRVESTACLWKEGKAALWGSPDLDVALQWREQDNPVIAWANRYGSNFPLAMEFLDTSAHRQKNRHLHEEWERQRTLELERKCQKLREETARHEELERHYEYRLQTLRTIQKELDLKHDRHLKDKHKHLKRRTLQLIMGSVAVAAILIVIGVKWTFDTAVKAQKEKQQAIITASEAQENRENLQLNSSTYKKMVAATFRFVAEAEQSKSFFRWVQETSALETLLPGLLLMIDTSEDLNQEEKAYWKDRLFAIGEEKQAELLQILGMAASEIVSIKQEFRIVDLVVKSEDNAIIHPWDGTYLLKQGEKIILEIDVNHPSDHDVSIEYSNIVKDSLLSEAKGTSSGISVTYVASRIAGSRDLVLIKLLDRSTGKIMDQKVVTVKVIESSLQPMDLESNE